MKRTELSKFRRLPVRGSHDWLAISRILDAGCLAHVGFFSTISRFLFRRSMAADYSSYLVRRLAACRRNLKPAFQRA